MTQDEFCATLLLMGFKQSAFTNVLRTKLGDHAVLEVRMKELLHQQPVSTISLNIRGTDRNPVTYYRYSMALDHIKRIINYTRERT